MTTDVCDCGHAKPCPEHGTTREWAEVGQRPPQPGVMFASTMLGMPATLAAATAHEPIPSFLRLVQAMDAEQLAAELERLDSDAKLLKRLTDTRKEGETIVRARLVELLGEGEVVQAPSGRLAFRGQVAVGKATVRTDALDEHFNELPNDLQPQPTFSYPTVTDIKNAVKDKRIDRKLAALLIAPAARAAGIRFRTINEGD